MATDLYAFLANVPKVEPDMPDRHIGSPPLAAAGIAISAASGAAQTVSDKIGPLFGVADVATISAWAGFVMAVVFGGLIPKSLDAWQDWRKRRREEDKLDREAFAAGLRELHTKIVGDLQRDIDDLRAENALLTSQSQAAIVGEVQHVNANVKNGPSLAKVLGEKLGDRVVEKVEQVAKTVKSVDSKVKHVAEGLSGSGVDINMDDSDPDAPTIPS